MKRTFLATSVAIPCLIALGINCSADDSAFVPPRTTSTTGGAGGGSATATTGGPTTSTATTTTGDTTTTATTTATTTTGMGGSGGAGGMGGMGMGGAAGGKGGAGGATGCLANGTNYSACFTKGSALWWTAAAMAVNSKSTPIVDNANEGAASLDGAFNIDTANGPQAGSDGIQDYNLMPTSACVPNEADPTIWKEMHWQLNGPGIVMGQPYNVTVRVLGVLECKTYAGGTGPGRNISQSAPTTATVNLFINGAQDNGDRYNTYALTVSPASNSALRGIGLNQASAPPAAQIWNFNQCPTTAVETHYTYKVDGTQVIPMNGGEWINYIEYDSNCRMICNCGTTMAAQGCGGKHTLDVSSTNPPPPAALVLSAQPPQNGNMAAGQWWIFDVTNIAMR